MQVIVSTLVLIILCVYTKVHTACRAPTRQARRCDRPHIVSNKYQNVQSSADELAGKRFISETIRVRGTLLLHEKAGEGMLCTGRDKSFPRRA